MSRGNPYDNFIHDELHLQKYGINDISDLIKETVVQLKTYVKKYNYQIILKPSYTIKTLDFNSGNSRAKIYFIGEKDSNNEHAINKTQTEQINKLVNFYNQEFGRNVDIFILMIMILSSIIAKPKVKTKLEKNKQYAIKKTEV